MPATNGYNVLSIKLRIFVIIHFGYLSSINIVYGRFNPVYKWNLHQFSCTYLNDVNKLEGATETEPTISSNLCQYQVFGELCLPF
ncbi:hypothetical protein KIN20_037312 [Parelaphostrongylus tenuis]|uniref:Uncharacterized protein n=1 Tax=Parelaphostrongylus tenuis TaxID=148309 RepID=A0AAD5REK4_PARTN|nr:hypothetical protein KIN20_037312 [Parelaphostrongylus tenuis]